MIFTRSSYTSLLVLLVGLASFRVGHRGQAEAHDARGAESETKFERQSIVVLRGGRGAASILGEHVHGIAVQVSNGFAGDTAFTGTHAEI